MRKGRTNLDREDMLVYIPKGGKSSKVVKVTYPVLKMTVVFGFMLSIIAGLGFLSLYFINENKLMNNQLQVSMENYGNEMVALSTYVGKQAILLDNKLNEMSNIESAQLQIGNEIKMLSTQLKEVSGKYLNNITLAGTSVTADNISKFAQETKDIANALDALLKTSEETQSDLVDFSQAAEMLYDYLDNIPTQWPTVSSFVASEFGMRDHPILNQYKQHTGVDIGGSVGEAIYAAASGSVISVLYEQSGYGYWFTIKHSQSITTLYAHCSSILVKPGDYVEKGQLVAYVGRTGLATGPHLHFEVRINNVPVNPLLFISYE